MPRPVLAGPSIDLSAAVPLVETLIGRPLRRAEQAIDVLRLDQAMNHAKDELEAAIRDEMLRATRAWVDGFALRPKLRVTSEMIEILDRLEALGREEAALELARLGYTGIRGRSYVEGAPSGRDVGGYLDRNLPSIGVRIENDLVAGDLSGASQGAIVDALMGIPGARDVASRVVSTALYNGFGQTFEENADLVSRWEYTAVMDEATCEECAPFDGEQYATLEDLFAVLPDFGPNPLCLGEGRCRCRAVPADTADAPQANLSPSGDVAFDDPEALAWQAGLGATDAEPAVTSALNAIAGENGGALRGLDFRFKSQSSLTRKIRDDAELKGISNAESAAQIIDALRYTIEYDVEAYTDGTEAALASLAERGYTVVKVKNYWTPGPYKGVNAVIETSRGYRFELQFHTPESLDFKETVGHGLYEQWRVEKDPERRAELWREMTRGSNALRRPRLIGRVGERKDQS